MSKKDVCDKKKARLKKKRTQVNAPSCPMSDKRYARAMHTFYESWLLFLDSPGMHAFYGVLAGEDERGFPPAKAVSLVKHCMGIMETIPDPLNRDFYLSAKSIDGRYAIGTNMEQELRSLERKGSIA